MLVISKQLFRTLHGFLT